MKAIQPLCKKAADMAFRYLDTDVVEQVRHSLRRDLPSACRIRKSRRRLGPAPPKCKLNSSFLRVDNRNTASYFKFKINCGRPEDKGTYMRIVCIGGGPAGLYFSLLMKKLHPEHHIRVVERNRSYDTVIF